MTPETLALYSGVVLSLVFSYVPGIESKYKGLDVAWKQLVMLGLLVLVAIGIFSIACAGMAGDFGLTATCDKNGVVEIIKILIMASIANQATYKLSPRKK